VDGSTPVNVDGFTLCTNTYTFTVAAVTSDGQTELATTSFDHDLPDILGTSLVQDIFQCV
jgi:hypothetical protein